MKLKKIVLNKPLPIVELRELQRGEPMMVTERFEAPEYEIEDVGDKVRLSCGGAPVLLPWSAIAYAKPADAVKPVEAPKPVQSVQKAGKR